MDSQGQLTRQGHLYWPAKPIPRGFTYRTPFLHVFTEAGLFLFNVETGVWVASAAGLRRLRPLIASDGHLCLMSSGGNASSSTGVVSKLAASQSAVSSGGGSGSSTLGSANPASMPPMSGAALIYLPPPRQSMFASTVQRRGGGTGRQASMLSRPVIGGQVERQLDLANVAPLDATVRARVSLKWIHVV